MLNETFGNWYVMAFAGVVKTKYMWSCRCACDKKKLIEGYSLRSGNSESCGCARKPWNKGKYTTAHPLYVTWRNMLQRCNNPHDPAYKDYGERGVRVCARWNDFDKFVEDMSPRPDGMSLDRYPDNTGDYAPENCRWATPAQQTRNLRTNINLTYDGRTQCIADWADELGVPRERLYARH